jgi:hypothetical protein
MYQDTTAAIPFCGLFLRCIVSARDAKMFSQEIQLQMRQHGQLSGSVLEISAP